MSCAAAHTLTRPFRQMNDQTNVFLENDVNAGKNEFH